jgi:hypothetical protein
VSSFDTLPDSDERKARERAMNAGKSRRIPKLRLGRKQKQSVEHQAPTAPMTQQAISYANGNKPPRQVPRVVKSGYRVAQGWISPAQAFNSLLVLLWGLWLIHRFHGWGLLSFKGVLLGLAFTVVELLLFSLVRYWLKLSGKRQGMVNAAVAVVVIMVSLFVAIVARYNDLLFTVALVFCCIVALADPIGFFNAKETLQAERDKYREWTRPRKAKIRQLEREAQRKSDMLTEALSAVGVVQDRLALAEAGNEAEISKRVEATKADLLEAARDVLNLSALQREASEAQAAADRQRAQYIKTHDQIREDVTAEVHAQYEGQIESLRRQLSMQAHIPPAGQPTFAGAPHQVIRPDGTEVGYDPGTPAGH